MQDLVVVVVGEELDHVVAGGEDQGLVAVLDRGRHFVQEVRVGALVELADVLIKMPPGDISFRQLVPLMWRHGTAYRRLSHLILARDHWSLRSFDSQQYALKQQFAFIPVVDVVNDELRLFECLAYETDGHRHQVALVVQLVLVHRCHFLGELVPLVRLLPELKCGFSL